MSSKSLKKIGYKSSLKHSKISEKEFKIINEFIDTFKNEKNQTTKVFEIPEAEDLPLEDVNLILLKYFSLLSKLLRR